MSEKLEDWHDIFVLTLSSRLHRITDINVQRLYAIQYKSICP